MAGNIEALGDFASAGLVSGVVDPDREHAIHAEGSCANCGASLHGRFCHDCGQEGHVHRSLGHAAHEFLHGITHFDGKLWRTLPMLAFRPGRLTRDYIEGRRARYVGPVALFLLCMFLMFFVFGLTGGAHVGSTGAKGPAEVAKLDRALGEIDRKIAVARADPAQAAAVPGLETARRAMAAERAAAAVGKGGEGLAEGIRRADAAGVIKVNTGNATLDERAREAAKNPELFLYKLQQKAYKLSFLLVPLSLPVMWLLFAWRRNVRMFDHAVFVLYSLSFVSLLLIATVLLNLGDNPVGDAVTPFLALLPFVHMFVQMKGAYRLSGWSTTWRMLVLPWATLGVLVAYTLLITLIGLVD